MDAKVRGAFQSHFSQRKHETRRAVARRSRLPGRDWDFVSLILEGDDIRDKYGSLKRGGRQNKGQKAKRASHKQKVVCHPREGGESVRTWSVSLVGVAGTYLYILATKAQSFSSCPQQLEARGEKRANGTAAVLPARGENHPR